MPYITVMQTPRTHQITLEEILNGEIPESAFFPKAASTAGTVTHYAKRIRGSYLDKIDLPSMIQSLEGFLSEYESLYEEDRHSLYSTFCIPKRSGGLRTINAPNPELMSALRRLKEIFEVQFHALYHTSAFAYVPGRKTVDAVAKHQRNGSRWFLKTDFSDFFGSTTEVFLSDMLSRIFPFSEIMSDPEGKPLLQKALNLCFLDGGLPQGTPISPMLTNLMMIPIDHYLSNTLRSNGFCYTRYADDIVISHPNNFSFSEKCEFINQVLQDFGAPFKIKPSKTRYGSCAGQNWILGVMLNKDHQITIGHQKKKQFKAMCNNYIVDHQKSIRWGFHDLQVFSGLIAYYKMVERDEIQRIIEHYNQKYHANLMEMLHKDLRS